MNNLRLTFVIALGLSGVAFACGTGSGTSTGSSSGGSSSQSFLAAFCNLAAPCCSKVNQPTDGAYCRSIYAALSGSSTYDATKGNACLAEMQAQSSTPAFCDNPTTKAPSCNGVYKKGTGGGGGGAAQPGDLCTKDSDCASPSEGSVHCASTYNGNAVTKSCQVELDGKAGDTPCLSTRDGNITSSGGSSSSSGDAGPTKPPAKGYVCDVANGVYCSLKTKACEAVHEIGGDCEGFDTYACVKAAYCDFSAKKCVVRKEIGGDCASNPSSCVEKASCDRTTKKCIARLPEGAGCATSDQCEDGQCVNSKCSSNSGSGGFSTKLICGGG